LVGPTRQVFLLPTSRGRVPLIGGTHGSAGTPPSACTTATAWWGHPVSPCSVFLAGSNQRHEFGGQRAKRIPQLARAKIEAGDRGGLFHLRPKSGDPFSPGYLYQWRRSDYPYAGAPVNHRSTLGKPHCRCRPTPYEVPGVAELVGAALTFGIGHRGLKADPAPALVADWGFRESITGKVQLRCIPLLPPMAHRQNWPRPFTCSPELLIGDVPPLFAAHLRGRNCRCR
jgi:hypothetical protein